MVYELSMLAGRKRSSKLQDFLGSDPSAFKVALLTTRPGPPKRIPSAPGSQLTLFGGKGLSGHSVLIRTAMIAVAQRILRCFFSCTVCNLWFTDKTWHTRPRWYNPENPA